MTSDEIRVALAEQGVTFTLLAQALGSNPSIVSRVAGRKSTSYRIAQGIAKALDRPVTDVFPDVPAYRLPRSHASRSERLAALKNRLGV